MLHGMIVAKIMVTVAFIPNIIFAIVVTVYAYLYLNDKPTDYDLCYQSSVMITNMFNFQLNVFNFATSASIGIFALALIILWIRHKKVTKSILSNLTRKSFLKITANSTISAGAQAQQIDMTKRMAVSSAATLFLVIIPVYMATINWPPVHSSIIIIYYIPNNVNPLVNVVLFLLKNRHMRRGLIAALKCQSLPPSLDTWTVTGKTVQVKQLRSHE
jgi:hypothetical protein